MKELKVLELFGGIGAFTKALERQHIPHKVVDYVDIDKYAVKSYNAMHGTSYEPQDIKEWDKDLEVDVIMHGSPCQDFSVAGKGAGGDAGSGTRSSLMYETLRIVEKLKAWKRLKDKGFKFTGWDRHPDYPGDFRITASDEWSVDCKDLDLLFGGEE